MFAKFHRKNQSEVGFTLVEIVVGMALLSIALVSLTNVFLPLAKRGIDPIWQSRATMLGQSLLNEIDAKAFDEQSDMAGGTERCNEQVACTQSAALGPEESLRSEYDDVDDFHGLQLSGSDIVGLLGGGLVFQNKDIYAGFSASVRVFYDSNLDGINDDDLDQNGVLDSGILIANRKLITVELVTPDNERIVFASVKDNF
ncbi:type IV pilus modification PilV family protein [Agaribacter flavus]|uniref:Prepilin-type cleavage/methylation-like protein n=1 Tax=Agaribacter flavus TaxID=1902781 RepID=A0ABV7FV43_9ALTE